jgi:hypothetical protein
VKVAKAHEGFGLPFGCNIPAGGYGPSQDEKPWGRGLRALLDCVCGVLWTSRPIVGAPQPVFGLAVEFFDEIVTSGSPGETMSSAGMT